nr:IS3 family transposase [Desulfoluna butyratoxydans]
MVDFVRAIRRDLGGDLNDVAYLNAPLGSDDGFLTANDVTAYAWASLSSKRGPIIVEVPPATDKVSYFGSILNAWSQPIEDVGPAGRDKGKGGKYLLLPPGYDGEKSKADLEKDGYFVYATDTYEYGFSFRPRLYNKATDKDAGDYAKRVKIYYLSEAANPPPTVMDLYSRQIVGWNIGARMTKRLVLDALDMAWWRRQPAPGLLHHSDRGSQYACKKYQERLDKYQMTCSMSRKGNCWDNAPVERFFRSLKSERLSFCRFETRDQARLEVLDYIAWYNSSRLHSTLGYVSPMEFEAEPLKIAA